MRCYGCGIEKDLAKWETYPYQDDETLDTEPQPALLTVECQGTRLLGEFQGEYRMAVVCHECWHRLLPGLWISQEQWEHLQPKVPWAMMVPMVETNRRWDAESYPDLASVCCGK